MSSAASAPLSTPGSTACSTHASNEPYQTEISDGLPDPVRLAAIGDVAELEAAYETERHLLYVACTRARDRLLVCGLAPGSEFLDDFSASG